MTYDIFISHPQEYSATVERFCDAFDKAGITYFCDCQDWDNNFKSNQGNISSDDTKKFRNILEPAIKDSRIILFLANKTTFKKPLFTSLLLKSHSLREGINMGLLLMETTEVSYDVEGFFIQVKCEVPEECELINDILCELGRPQIFPEIDPQKYTRRELDEIIKKGDKYYDDRKYQKAIEMYHIAAACNVADAQYKLGCGINSRLKHYIFCHIDDDESLIKYESCHQPYNELLLKAAADQGYADALLKLGSKSLNDWGRPERVEDVILFQRAAEQGHIEAQRELAKIIDLEQITQPNLGSAEYWYEKAAIQGDWEAQVRLADLYSMSKGSRYDFKKTIIWYRMAAENNAMGQKKLCDLSLRTLITLGIIYAKGIGCSTDEAEALHWFSMAMKEHDEKDIAFFLGRVYRKKKGDMRDAIFENAVDGFLKEHSRVDEIIDWIKLLAIRGNVDAQFKLGQLYYNTFPAWLTRCVKKDIGKAVYWYKTAAKNGHKESQYKMGFFYEYGVITNGRVIIKKNDKIGARWYRKSAEKGYEYAQFRLGVMYACGEGVKKNDVKAARWYRKAAMNGHRIAQNELATMYYNGDGVKCNYRKSEQWYLEAAKRGLSDAQYNLAESYWQGEFGAELTKAIRWYRLAADRGNAKAQNILGVYYQSGIAVVKDTEQAMFWFRKAAELGYALAQRNLAIMIAKGKGSRKKKAESIEWLRKAAKQGDEVAIKELPRFEHLYGSTIPQSDNLK